MQKNQLLIWTVIIGLSATFLALEIAMRILGARPTLVRHKYKLGSLIILFGAMLAACNGSSSSSKDTNDVMCYDYALIDAGQDGSADTDTATDENSDTDS